MAKIMLVGTFFPYPGPVSRFLKDVQELNHTFSRFSTTPQIKKNSLKNKILAPTNSAGFPLTVIKQTPDIIHIQTSRRTFKKCAFYVIVSKLMHKKVILHYHGSDFIKFYKTSPAKFLIRMSLKRADKVLVSSRAERVFLKKKLNINSEKISPFIDLTDYHAKKHNSKNIKVLFAGNLDRTAGIGDMIKSIPLVVKKNPNVEFTFLGHGDKTSWYGVCKLMGVEKNVSFIGYLSKEDRLNLFKEADVFSLPSRVSSFPTSVLEAMACATPVVTTRMGLVPEVVEDGTNGFIIRPGDYIQLAGKLNFLIEHKKTRIKIGANNLVKVKEYDKSTVLDKINHIYYNL